jgi:hypothetical protein
MSTPKLNLYPITGINMYAIPIPELVKQLQHATNDETYKGESAETGQDTNLSTSLSTSNVDVDVTSPSDTPSTSKVIPIHRRHTIYK